MPIARIFYAGVMAFLVAGAYVYMAYIFVPIRPRQRKVILVMCFILATLPQWVLNLVPSAQVYEPQYEWVYVVGEIGGIIILAIGCEESVWIGYGKMLEFSMIRNILTTLMKGKGEAMSRRVSEISSIQSFSEYQSVLSMIILYVVLFLIVQLFRRWNLFGRIPCLFWEIIVIVSMSLTVLDIVWKLCGKSGISMNNDSMLFYLEGIVPFVSASVILFLRLKSAKQKENEKIKEMLEAQYQYYQDLRDYQMKIREFRHDLLNHVETIRYIGKSQEDCVNASKQYIEKLLESLKGEEKCH